MATITGTNGNNTLTGTSRADTINALAGDDRVYANGGNDTVRGGTGNDGLYGQGGNDSIFGEDGIDALIGAAGDDQLFAGLGDDWLDGGLGRDRIFGNQGQDVLRGGGDRDVLDGGPGNDNLHGGTDGDFLIHSVSGEVTSTSDFYVGGDGVDTMGGNAIGATVTGSVGVRPAVVNIGQDDGGGGSMSMSDPEGTSFIPQAHFFSMEAFDVADEAALSFWGSNQASTVSGTNNNDIFRSGASNEVFAGGAGADAYYISYGQQGSDAISGFVPGEDIIAYNIWSEDGQLATQQFVEPGNGHTIIQTFDLEGNLMHSLDVDVPAVTLTGVFRDGMDYEHFFFT
jgi:Ca2+-binding RTX toxin-like protein